MGTKRALVPEIREVIARAQPGVMLDAFAGMGSIGEAVSSTRQVWNNDTQIFAHEVLEAVFVSQESPLTPLACGDVAFERFEFQKRRLSRNFHSSLALEQLVLDSLSFETFEKRHKKFRLRLSDEIMQCALRSPHLFSTTYSGTFFGIQQAIEIDSIAAAIQFAKAERKISKAQSRWLTIALGRALLKLANSTGHFAQYLTPKKESFQRYIRLRKRSLWAEWLASLAEISPVGNASWRVKNRAFNADSLDLLPRLARAKTEIALVYADPPYTDDQYSRYYHVLETLCLYDYPDVTGAGLYRPGRFQTPFSLKAKAIEALNKLITASAKTGADLVMSYPTNGLVVKAGGDVMEMLRKKFKRVEICHAVAHLHSTFGASKGPARSNATELIYLAKSS